MKILPVFFSLSLALVGCGTPLPSATSLATQASKPTPQNSPAPTTDTEATLQVMSEQLATAQDSEREKQLEIDALNRLNIDATITAEANQMAIAAITQQVYQTSVSGTQTAIPMTQTAFPLVATMQKNQQEAQAAQITEAAAAPTLEWANARARNADEILMGDVVLRLALAACLILGGMSALFLVVVDLKQRYDKSIAEQQEKTPSTPEGLLPLPAVTESAHDDNYKIPCTVEQLVAFADGVIVIGKGVQFREWGDNPAVYRTLKDMRQWLNDNQFCRHVGSYGELEFTEEGRAFLEDTVALRKPPAPYVCKDGNGRASENN